MIALAPIIDQVKGVTGYRTVEGLFEFAALKAPPRALPAAYIVPQRESAAPLPRVGAHDQKITFGFSVILILDPPGRSTGQAAETLRIELRKVKDALFGWKHPEAADGCALAGGQLLELDASSLVWKHDFPCHYRERKT